MPMEIQDLVWYRHKNVEGFNQLIRSQLPSLIDDSNTDENK
jgi:hypothetical protein